MKNTVITAFPKTEPGNKPKAQQYRSDAFHKQSTLYDQFRQSHYTCQLQCVDTLLKQLPLTQTDLSSNVNRKEDADRHKSKAACLDEQKYDKLAKQCPVTTGIRHHQPCHTGSACRRKKGVQETGRLPFCRNGQHEKQRSQQYNDKKSCRYHLHLRQTVFPAFFHDVILFQLFPVFRMQLPPLLPQTPDQTVHCPYLY